MGAQSRIMEVCGLLAGLFVHYLPAPTVLIYFVLVAVFLTQALGVIFMAETVTRRPGGIRRTLSCCAPA